VILQCSSWKELMTIFRTLADNRRLNIIKNSCDNDFLERIDFAVNQALKEIDTSTSSIISLFEAIDTIDSLDIDNMPAYSLESRNVQLIGDDEMEHAISAIRSHGVVGFDTEQRPTFKSGAPSNGIAIIQISTASDCFIFQVKRTDNISQVLDILQDHRILKIGIGLKGDKSAFKREFDIKLQSCADIEWLFTSKLGYENQIGTKKSVAFILGNKIQKSKSMSTSNWEAPTLSNAQIKYAAEDSSAAYDVFTKMMIDYPFLMESMPKWIHNKF